MSEYAELSQEEFDRLTMAEEFMSNFVGNQVFMRIPESKDRKAEGNGNVFPVHYPKTKGKNKGREASIEVDGAELLRFNGLGDGIFFAVNELDQKNDEGKQRTGKMFVRGRALFIDDDVPRVGHRDDFPLDPNIVVCTSKNDSGEGKYHYYWLIDGGQTNSAEYLRLLRVINRAFGGDANVKDLPRVLRVPGFNHMKGSGSGSGDGNDGILVTYEVVRDGKYEWDELVESFGGLDPSTDYKSLRGMSDSNDVQDAPEGNQDDGNDGDEHGKSYDQWILDLESGVDIHDCLVNLSWQMAKDGMKERMIIGYLEHCMEKIPAGVRDGIGGKGEDSGRWESRYRDIGRITRQGIGKVKAGIDADEDSLKGQIDLGELEEMAKDGLFDVDVLAQKSGDIPYPPGMFGELVRDAWNMSRYQYREVAFVSACGLVAGICGRKFNVSDTGLNVYLTLIMDTGMGKDSIGKFIKNTLHMCNGMGKSGAYLGPKRFTGPKAVINALNKNRSMVSVFTEAGILMRSAAGDQEGLTRCLLGLYTESGKYDWTGSEEFSSAEGRIDSINSPALTIVNEATPETLIGAFADSGSLENGHLPRQSIFRVMNDKPHANRDVKAKVSSRCLERLKELALLCSGEQFGDSPDVVDVNYHIDIGVSAIEFQDECVDLENKAKAKGNDVKRIMASRMYLKAAKFAALCAVFNHEERCKTGTTSGSDYVIMKDDWEWAKKMVLWEYAGTESFFSGSNFNNVLDDLAMRVVCPVIFKFMLSPKDGGYKGKCALGVKERESQTVSLSQMSQKLRNCKRLSFDYKHTNPHDGLKSVIKYMVEMNYLREIEVDIKGNGLSHRSVARYQVLPLLIVVLKATE